MASGIEFFLLAEEAATFLVTSLERSPRFSLKDVPFAAFFEARALAIPRNSLAAFCLRGFSTSLTAPVTLEANEN